MRRVILALGTGYLVLAVAGHIRESSGSITCGCRTDCWCKRPGPSLFRWVFPLGHRLRGPGGEA